MCLGQQDDDARSGFTHLAQVSVQMSVLSLKGDIDILRVGGAVRDELLGYAFDEVDWVVVGAKPDDLLDAGFKQVGNDFPVFLHPTTGEEYALARTERKVGRGYNGFTVHADPTVTLEEDLRRRDLTINAMARSAQGELIDPYGGEKDLRARRLRHVSDSFIEDPLRVLRVCRFAARYHHLGFEVADETMDLMRLMVKRGELAELAPDRLWRETERALTEQHPEVFFSLLHSLGLGTPMYPFTLSQKAIERLASVRSQFSDSLRRWAALTADDFSLELAHRAVIPKRHLAISRLTSDLLLREKPRSASDALDLLDRLDAFRQGSLAEAVLDVIDCIDTRFESTDILRIQTILTIAASIGGKAFAAQGLTGKDIKLAIQKERVDATKHLF